MSETIRIPAAAPQDGVGFYLHVPFCRQKCAYCDFYSMPATDAVRAQYTDLLCRMLRQNPFGRQTVRTVYWGGGTPPMLGAGGIARVMDVLREYHTLLPGAEVTLECNPDGVDEAFFKAVREAGISRVSMGLQTADPLLLKKLGRTHSPQDAEKAVEAARKAGITNISLDIMLALPGQTEALLDETIRFVLRMGIPHVSAYLLKVEPGTPLARQGGREQPEEDQADRYLQTVKRLEEGGLMQYEISNFARPGFESRHNLIYWRAEPYLGFGPAAHSFRDGKRFFFPRDLSAMLRAEDPFSLLQEDGSGGGLEEEVLLRLRLREGIDLSFIERQFGKEHAAFIARRAAPLIPAGLMRREGERLSLTPQGFLLSNSIICRLLED